MDLNLTSLFYRATNQTVCSGSASEVNKIIFESNAINSNNKEITENINFNSSIISYGINPMAIKRYSEINFEICSGISKSECARIAIIPKKKKGTGGAKKL